MSQQPTPEVTNPPTKPPGEPRYVVLLLITALATLGGGLLASVAVGALLSFLPALAGVLVGMLFGFALPIFLAVRATLALRRRALPALLRRFVVLLLIGATQLAVAGAVLTWSARTTGHLAATAAETLDVIGGVPVLSGILKKHAKTSGVVVKGGPAPRPMIGPDGGVVYGPDGGILGIDGGILAEAPDAGPLYAPDGGLAAKDGGVATVVDAGPAIAPSALKPAPVAPRAGVGLSPRSTGKTVRTACAALVTNTGDTVLALATVQGGGAVTWRTLELGAHEKLGPPTLVECADDGGLAAILGGTHVVTAKPGRAGLDVVKALAPGAQVGGLEVQATRDVAIAPGGVLLAVVDVAVVVDGGPEVGQALVVVNKQGAASVLRKRGDGVPGADAGSVAHTFALKKPVGTATVVVAETWLDGGVDRGVRISGEQYELNEQRLLSVKLDAPKPAPVELVASGVEPSGIDGVHLQAFGDAALLPDGRLLFDANFAEKGPDGWLFLARSGSGVAAVAGALRATGAPWGPAAPRLAHLEADVTGVVIARRADGALLRMALDQPAQASAVLQGADALAADGKRRGAVVVVDVPLLARGGGLVIASAQVKDGAGPARDAIVLASTQDLDNGKAEVLLLAGDALPGAPAAAGAPARTVQSIRLGKGRDELLWQR